jgi:hypothetical protein
MIPNIIATSNDRPATRCLKRPEELIYRVDERVLRRPRNLLSPVIIPMGVGAALQRGTMTHSRGFAPSLPGMSILEK